MKKQRYEVNALIVAEVPEEAGWNAVCVYIGETERVLMDAFGWESHRLWAVTPSVEGPMLAMSFVTRPMVTERSVVSLTYLVNERVRELASQWGFSVDSEIVVSEVE